MKEPIEVRIASITNTLRAIRNDCLDFLDGDMDISVEDLMQAFVNAADEEIQPREEIGVQDSSPLQVAAKCALADMIGHNEEVSTLTSVQTIIELYEALVFDSVDVSDYKDQVDVFRELIEA